MKGHKIQYISDEQGKTTAVIVPIELWQDIVGEKGKSDDDFWYGFSLERAMHGLENDNLPEYRISDIKEKFSK